MKQIKILVGLQLLLILLFLSGTTLSFKGIIPRKLLVADTDMAGFSQTPEMNNPQLPLLMVDSVPTPTPTPNTTPESIPVPADSPLTSTPIPTPDTNQSTLGTPDQQANLNSIDSSTLSQTSQSVSDIPSTVSPAPAVDSSSSLPVPPADISSTGTLSTPDSPATPSDPVATSVEATVNNPVALPTVGQAILPIETQTVIASASILKSSDETLSSETISPQILTQAKNEQQQINNASSPEIKSNLLVTFAQDKINTITTQTTSNNFFNTLATNQWLNQQIDTLIQNEKNLGQSKSALKTTQNVKTLCQNVDKTLRSAQLVVPEEFEQDLEISRSKCANL
jgi:hypothetical protein